MALDALGRAADSMKGAYKIATVAGIDVFVHWTFLLVLGYVAYSGFRVGAPLTGVLAAIGFVIALFFCIVLHELGHALTARLFGCRTKDIVIWLIGGVARLERMPQKPLQELAVAVAGPAVNVVIALLLGVAVVFLPPASGISVYSDSLSGFVSLLMVANAFIVVFNMIPALPMDGGRVLRSLLAIFLDHARATTIAALIGQVVAVGFIGFGLWAGEYMLAVIGAFVFFGARQEAGASRTRTKFHNRTVADAMESDVVMLEPQDTLDHVLSYSDRRDFPVIEDGRIVGLVTSVDVAEAASMLGPQTPVAHFMRSDYPMVEVDESLLTALERLHGQPAAVVLERGELAGLITPASLASFMRGR